jgi:hypothetical protein
MPPWEKFWRGGEMVRTEYASLCADDDLVLVSSIRPIAEFLDAHPDYSLAHGWYFNFYLNGALGLTGIIYKSPSIDEDDPVARLHHLFRRYEALTYGVHRTVALQRALRQVQKLRSMLGRELLGGAIAAVSGKVARLPLLFSGRSLGPSAPYVDWHPAEFLLSSPQSLFDEYVRYRGLLLESLVEAGGTVTEETVNLVDLAHLRYVSEYFKPEVIDYLIEQLRAGTPRVDIVGGMWPILAGKRGTEGVLQRCAALRRIRDRFFPWVRGYHVRKVMGTVQFSRVESTTASGRHRSYEVYEAFRAALAPGRGITPSCEDVMSVLRGYE